MASDAPPPAAATAAPARPGGRVALGRTLRRAASVDPVTFAAERERIFVRMFCAGGAEPTPAGPLPAHGGEVGGR